MPSNGLSGRRRRFPRPTVCKPSNPNDCPQGELQLTDESLDNSPHWVWIVAVQLLITEGDPAAAYTVETTCYGGVPDATPDYQFGLPYSFSTQGDLHGQTVLLFVLLTDGHGCRYLASISKEIPPLP